MRAGRGYSQVALGEWRMTWKPGAADHPPYKQLSHYKQIQAGELPGRRQEWGLYIIRHFLGFPAQGDIDVHKQPELKIWCRKGRTELGWGRGGSGGQLPGAAKMFGVPATIVLEKMTPRES